MLLFCKSQLVKMQFRLVKNVDKLAGSNVYRTSVRLYTQVPKKYRFLRCSILTSQNVFFSLRKRHSRPHIKGVPNGLRI